MYYSYTSVMNIVLYLVIILVPLFAQINVSASFSKYKKVDNKKKVTGFDVARKILDANGLEDIYIVETGGNLTDHYDPTRKVIKLSHDIFHGESIAAASVAAHECGHAIQDKVGYKFMRFRSLLVPVVNLVSSFSWIVILIGLLTEYFQIFIFGIGLISIGLLFQLVTLPVEFDASKRAKIELKRLKLIDSKEESYVSKMLGAAALTYVAGVLTSILEIVRLLIMFNDSDR